MMDRNVLATKLDYLRELRGIDARTNDEIRQRDERINKVCDSIEADLGIGSTTSNAKPSHQCIGCGYQCNVIAPHIQDGLRCFICGNPVVPISSLPTKYPPG